MPEVPVGSSWGAPPTAPQPLRDGTLLLDADEFPRWAANCACGARFLCFSHRQFTCSCGRVNQPRGRAIRINTFVSGLFRLIRQHTSPHDPCICGGTLGAHNYGHEVVDRESREGYVGACMIEAFMQAMGIEQSATAWTTERSISFRVDAEDASVVPSPAIAINPGEET